VSLDGYVPLIVFNMYAAFEVSCTIQYNNKTYKAPYVTQRIKGADGDD